MAGKTSKTEGGIPDLDEMFGEPDTDSAGGGDDFDDDLLNQIEEDDSEGWVPTEKGEGLVGRVVKLGETRSDFAKDGEDPMCPTVTIQTKDGTKWRIIGYGAVLKRELADWAPQIGEIMAIKYFGEKPLRKGRFAGKPYKHFQIAIAGR